MNPEIKSRLHKIRNGIVPEGYKKTKIGIIPEGWEIKILNSMLNNEIVSHLDGNHGELYPRAHEFVQYGIPFIAANCIENNTLNLNSAKFLTEERANQFNKGVAHDGDVLFAHNATVGPVAILRTKLDKIILSTSLTYYRCNLKKLSNLFLKNYMESSAFIFQIEKIMKQTTRNQIPITTQRNLFFILPPLHEQSRIATILSTWDKAIELKEKLIEKKKLQKKGLMQMLLTGKKRIINPESGKPFVNDWEKVKLVKLIKKWADGGTPSRKTNKEYFNGDINWIVIDDIKHYIYETKEKLTNEGFEKCSSELWPIESVILSTGATIGLCGILKKKSATKQGITGIITNERILKNEYLRYWFLNNKKLLIRYAQGSSFKEIRTNNLAELPFSKPSIIEQQFIVSVLSVADKKIELLENELEQLKEQKRGLMQLLLTGIVRVNDLIPDPSPNSGEGRQSNIKLRDKSFLARKDLGR